MKLMGLILSAFFSVSVWAAPAYLPVPKSLGPAKTPVYHVASQARLEKRTQAHSIYSLEVVLKWGVHAFEKGLMTFKCESMRAQCELLDYEASQTFEKCSVRKGQLQCSNPLAADTPAIEERDPHLDPAAPYQDEPEVEGNPSFEEPVQSEEKQNPHFEESNWVEPTERAQF